MLPCSKLPLFFIFIHLFSLPLAFADPPNSLSSNTTIYELLPKFGLPSGLLPSTVTNFAISNSNGDFVVELAKPCYIQFEYLVYYDQIITGSLQYGGIVSLKGIQVRRFLLWFDVDAIKVDLPPSEYIYFQVGWITKKLGVEQFENVHSCVDKESCGGVWESSLRVPSAVQEITMLLTD